MSDDSYNYFESGFEEAISEFQEESKPSDNLLFPLSFVGAEGSYIFRIYPENYRGKPRIMRTFWSCSLHDKIKIVAKEDDTRISELCDKAHKEGLEDAWKYKPQKFALCLAYLYQSPENDFVKPSNSVSALYLRKRHIEAINIFFEQYAESGGKLVDLLHPGKSAPALVLNIGRDSKNKITVNVSCTSKSFELPKMELEEGVEFTGLDDIYIKHDAYLTDEIYNNFKKFLNQKIIEVNAGLGSSSQFNPEKKSKPAPNREEPPWEGRNKTEVQKPSSDEFECALKIAVQNGEHPPEGLENVDFGHYPSTEAIECMMCPQQEECMKKSGKW